MNFKHAIKIPNNISVFYHKKKNILSIKGPLTQRSLKLKLKIILLKKYKLIIFTTIPGIKASNDVKKKMKALQGSTLKLIRTVISETNNIIYKRLNLVGVGYRAFPVENYEKQLLLFKLGYSHLIYFKIPENLSILSLKFTKLFVFGNSYQGIHLVTSILQRTKLPEPYKGKGIVNENKKIILKQGKKI